MISPREELRRQIDRRCLKVGEQVTLSSGAKSTIYFDLKPLLLDGVTLCSICDRLLDYSRRLPIAPIAIGGPAMGANALVAGVCMRAYQMGYGPTLGSIARPRKAHGTELAIDNTLPKGTTIVVVDDVITSGASMARACDTFEAAGYRVVGVIAVVDRCDGGIEMLQARYLSAHALYDLTDFYL